MADSAVEVSNQPEVENNKQNEEDNEVANEADKKPDKKKSKNKKSSKVVAEKAAGNEKEKAHVKAIKEQLAAIEKLKAEQRAEEERKQREAEEAERAREERERLERERRERKKQKEKEKRERKKQEGTLLTEQQKHDKRRLQELVEQQRAAGIDIPLPKGQRDIPAGADAPKKKPVYERKRKNLPNNANSEQPASQAEQKTVVDAENSAPKTEEVAPVATPVETNAASIEVQEVDDDAVKENWFDEDDSDKQSESKSQSESENEQDNENGGKADAAKNANADAESETINVSEPTYEDESLRRAAYERARLRIVARREAASTSRRGGELRAPVVCVLGHVDTGKTKLLDALRNTDVQAREAGGITQQIGATNVPSDALREAIRFCKPYLELRVPGLLIIDTPGHESFSNLRSRGNSLCDMAVLVIDIMHGVQQQTLESLTLLRKRRTPFVIALNKIDRLYGWVSDPNSDIIDTLGRQAANTRAEFKQRFEQVKLQLAEQGINAAAFNENPDHAEYISIVPTSAHTRDGLGNLLHTLCTASQTRLAERVTASGELQASVMEVKAIPGLGTTCDVVLVNGTLHEGDTLVLAGQDGRAIVTQARGLLMTAPLRELRVKNSYEKRREVRAACGVKLVARDLERAMAGMPLLVAEQPDEIAVLRDEVEAMLASALSALKPTDVGVYVQASTLGSLEALVDYLKSCKVPYSGLSIGPVHKRDVMKASVMLERDKQWAVILAFDVKVERDAAQMADELGVRIFTARIIYHLFDALQKYRDELREAKKSEFRSQAVFPCRLRVLPQFIFRDRDPIIFGVVVEAGALVSGTPLCVVTIPKDKEPGSSAQKELIELGRVSSIEFNHKSIDKAVKGQEVCIKIDPVPGEPPRQYGRHFDDKDDIVSRVTRESIDVLKEYFRDEMKTTDWQVVIELKKLLNIL